MRRTLFRERRIHKKDIPGGVVHTLPADLREALISDPKVLAAWKDLSPLARNEWICWVTSVKKDRTRKEHIQRAVSEVRDGMRRPCCWIGCIHRADKPVSPSVQAILKQQRRS